MDKTLLRLTLCLLVLILHAGATAPCQAQEFQAQEFQAQEVEQKEGKKRWLLSAVALIAASALDAHSSHGRFEANPLLRGPDGTFSSRRAFVVKAAASGGLLLLQAILIKQMPERNLYKSFAITNTVAASVTAGAAIRNYRVAAPTSLVPPSVAPSSVTAPSYVLRESIP